jgi:hypothetical protein
MLSDTPASAIPPPPSPSRPRPPEERAQVAERQPASAEPPASPHVELGLWQQRWAQNLLPLATSITFHLTLVLIAALVIVPYKILTCSPQREQIIIPEASIVDAGPVGGIPNPGLGGDPNLTAAQNTDPNVTSSSEGWATKRSDTLTAALMGGGAAANSEAADSVIGLGTRIGFAGSGGHGSGEAGGALAPFGVPGGGSGLGPKAPFMGISGNAHKVVYICDASGSMMSVFWRVRDKLRDSVSQLGLSQSFNVIFFSDVDVTTLSKNGLVVASPDNKRKALEMAEKMSAAGTTDPLPAIRMAFAQQPELIYVLTDGFDQVVSFDAVINEFRKLNVNKKVRVNTILIRSSGNAELERVVKIIASENGGVCKIIDRQDM